MVRSCACTGMRQTFESDTRVRACAVRVAMDGAMEGAGGQTGGVIGAGDHCRLASERLGRPHHRSKEEGGGRRRKERGRMKERRGREGRLNGLARAEDKRRDGVVGLVAER